MRRIKMFFEGLKTMHLSIYRYMYLYLLFKSNSRRKDNMQNYKEFIPSPVFIPRNLKKFDSYGY